MNRKDELNKQLARLESMGYPGSESREFKAACDMMNRIEEELKTLEAAGQKINTKTRFNIVKIRILVQREAYPF